MIKPFEYVDGVFKILDQRELPAREVWLDCVEEYQVAEAIKTLAVRGAPAIGIAAAYGLALAAGHGRLESAAELLVAARPTAVNLAWAVKRVLSATADAADLPAAVLSEAAAIWAEEIAANERMAELALELFPAGRTYNILTHCNAGALATGGIGTALGVIRALKQAGRLGRVYADETRPLLQGARLTAYELDRDGIEVVLITDNMAGWAMHQGLVDAVVVGADRIAANFDTANKIGTYSVSILAREHGLPFYVAAPQSTFDPATPDGHAIVIEERGRQEVLGFGRERTAPDVNVFNPAFDVTPSANITAFITETGLIRP